MARQEGGQCSIAAMKHPLAWTPGGFALFGFLRRRRGAPSRLDPRADELRRKLAESRPIVEGRGEFEGAEGTVDLAQPAPEESEAERRRVHESVAATVERIRDAQP